MKWRRPWVVLVPGNLDWVEKRTREILEEERDGSENHFRIIPGQGRYQVIVEKGYQDIGPEMVLGGVLSRECDEPVYVIEDLEEYSYVTRFQSGEDHPVDQEPEELVRSLGCVIPWAEEPPQEPYKKPTRTAALIQGLSEARVHRALGKQEPPRPPGFYRLERSPQGLLLQELQGSLGFALIGLAHRFPLATIYSVTATPSLDFFVVSETHERKTKKFSLSPAEFSLFPVLDEVMGERTPERILAALGIPKEWFQL